MDFRECYHFHFILKLTEILQIQHKNVQEHHTVPQTPLLSVDVLREGQEDWEEIQRDMEEALEEMRIKNPVRVNPPSSINNPLLARRDQKRLKTDPSAKKVPSMSTLNLRAATDKKLVELDGLTIEDLSPYVVVGNEMPKLDDARNQPKIISEPKNVDKREMADPSSVRHYESIIIEDLSRENSTVAPK